jgi:thiaminase/transcriptional activator TenA
MNLMDQSPYTDGNCFFGRLRTSCAPDWQAYTHHEFVARLGDGSLPESCFRHYLIQDYLFLIHFARAYALAIYKSDNLEDMRAAAAIVNALLNVEMGLHVEFCAEWGISEQEMRAVPEAAANSAYTRYVLERGMAGDVLDLYAALAPCVIGYGEVGARLRADAGEGLQRNPYAKWIEMYGGEEYQADARSAVDQLNELAAKRLTDGRWPDLVATFGQATRLEIGFWQMGLAPGQ